MTRLSLAVSVLFAALAAEPSAQIVFQPPVASDGGGPNVVRTIVGDVNEDGFPDVIVSHHQFFDMGPPSLLFGQGDGTFADQQEIPDVGAGRVAVQLADFDEDGHLDLVVLSGTVSPPLNAAVRLGDGAGGFGPPVGVNSNDVAPADADAGDFDGDGHLDVVVYNRNQLFVLGSVAVAYGHGDGSFEPAIRAVVIDTVQPTDKNVVRAGDTNGDGLDDLVFSDAEPVALANRDRSFTFAPCSGCFNFNVYDLVLADLDGDGRDDAVTPSEVLMALPSGAFGAPQPLASAFVPRDVALGDLDGDGLLDLAIGRTDTQNLFDSGTGFGDVLIRQGNGDGTFQAPDPIVSHTPQPRELSLADLDLDGRLDLVIGNMQPSPSAVTSVLNFTYAPGSPFLDLGGALAGSNGYPIQLASGTLVAGQPFSFKLANGPPSGAAYHIVGVSQLAAPFKGGTLIPFPNLINGPLPLNANGGINLAALWPAGGSGLTLWVQFWMPNGGGPAGFVASSGVRAQIP